MVGGCKQRSTRVEVGSGMGVSGSRIVLLVTISSFLVLWCSETPTMTQNAWVSCIFALLPQRFDRLMQNLQSYFHIFSVNFRILPIIICTPPYIQIPCNFVKNYSFLAGLSLFLTKIGRGLWVLLFHHSDPWELFHKWWHGDISLLHIVHLILDLHSLPRWPFLKQIKHLPDLHRINFRAFGRATTWQACDCNSNKLDC